PKDGADRRHPLVRASGVKKTPQARFVDATAGLGSDALILAMMGAKVTLLERSPSVFNALKGALARASDRATPEVADALQRLELRFGDSRMLLPQLDAEIVIVDPMHPPRRKSALTKKNMRILKQVVGDDDDSHELMACALRVARKRVVLKWPRRAPAIEGLPKETFRTLGTTIRYDVFVVP
ncbi:MAG: class I SAM-dependent methyltransferase, partial [Pseudomonadota bacterium]